MEDLNGPITGQTRGRPFRSQSGHSRGFGIKSRSGVDEIRAEQTHIKHQPPRTCTHTLTHSNRHTRRGWPDGLEGRENKRQRERRERAKRKRRVRQVRGGRNLSYKQVKSEAASLESQHRGWWHTELPGWCLQLSSKRVQRLAGWFTDWPTSGSDLVYPVFVQQKHFCCSACLTKSSSPQQHTKNNLKQH